MSHNPQLVPKLLLAFNEWQKNGHIDKATGEKLKNLTLAKNQGILDLASEIGVTPELELCQKALAVMNNDAAASSSLDEEKTTGRRGRPALNISAVKATNSTAEAAQLDEQESQADALLKAKRERNLKRQSMPEKFPDISDQLNPTK